MSFIKKKYLQLIKYQKQVSCLCRRLYFAFNRERSNENTTDIIGFVKQLSVCVHSFDFRSIKFNVFFPTERFNQPTNVSKR